MGHDFRKGVKNNPWFDPYFDKYIGMMSEFESTLDRHPGHISVAKHRVEYTSEKIRPLNSAPYRAGRRPSEIEKIEIDKMGETRAIESTQMELADPLVFAPEKDGSLRFLSTMGS